jgi:hypothetical protein
MSKLQLVILKVLAGSSGMTTLNMLNDERLIPFWFLQLRLYGAVGDLVEQGKIHCVRIEYPSERAYHERRYYVLSCPRPCHG